MPRADVDEGGATGRLMEVLARITEEGRLGRAGRLAPEVVFLVADRELVIAAVGNYNVLIDGKSGRVLHGCRDFQSQAREGRLCKHVAAVLLALEEGHATDVAGGLEADDGRWHLDVVQ